MNDQRRCGDEAGREALEIDTDGSLEIVAPLGLDREWLSAACAEREVLGRQRHFEVWLRPADRQLVLEIIAGETADIGHANEVRPVARRDERQPRIFAQLSLAIVVVGKVQREDGQAVVRKLRTNGVRNHDVARLADRMRAAGCLKKSMAIAVFGIELGIGIGARGAAERA